MSRPLQRRLRMGCGEALASRIAIARVAAPGPRARRAPAGKVKR